MKESTIQSKGYTYFVETLNTSYKECQDSFNTNNSNDAMRCFYNYLFHIFSIREKLGIKDYIPKNKKFEDLNSEEQFFRALKNLYNVYKHEYNINNTIDTKIFCSSKKYPYTYPYYLWPKFF